MQGIPESFPYCDARLFFACTRCSGHWMLDPQRNLRSVNTRVEEHADGWNTRSRSRSRGGFHKDRRGWKVWSYLPLSWFWGSRTTTVNDLSRMNDLVSGNAFNQSISISQSICMHPYIFPKPLLPLRCQLLVMAAVVLPPSLQECHLCIPTLSTFQYSGWRGCAYVTHDAPQALSWKTGEWCNCWGEFLWPPLSHCEGHLGQLQLQNCGCAVGTYHITVQYYRYVHIVEWCWDWHAVTSNQVMWRSRKYVLPWGWIYPPPLPPFTAQLSDSSRKWITPLLWPNAKLNVRMNHTCNLMFIFSRSWFSANCPVLALTLSLPRVMKFKLLLQPHQ